MEKLLTIKQAFPLVERPYTDRNGIQTLFASRAFIFSDGIDTIHAEAVGDYARSIANVDFQPGTIHAVILQFTAREWKDKDGVTRYSNEARITRIGY